jgi:hypothetical protein
VSATATATATKPQACVDCGVTDATVLIEQQATVLGRVKRWLVCGRCFLTRRSTP